MATENTHKVIGIIGTRRRDTGKDYGIVRDKFLEIFEDGDWICSGKATKGGDRFAIMIKDKYFVPYLEFPANWPRFRGGAGMIRNTDIAKWSTVLIACVAEDRTGGTEDTITKFKEFHPDGTVILV